MSDDEKKRKITPSGAGNDAQRVPSLDGGARGYDQFAGWSVRDRDAYSRLSGTWTFAGTPHSFALITHLLSEKLSGPVRRFELFPIKNWEKVQDTPNIARVVVLLPGVDIDRQPKIDHNGKLQFHLGQVTAVLSPDHTTQLRITVQHNAWSKVEHWWNRLYQELEIEAPKAAYYGQARTRRNWTDVPERDRKVIQWLCDEHSVASTAKEFGISEKSVRRIESDLRKEFPEHVPYREHKRNRRRKT
ncbi:MAG: helix-turn-helix domain containing protein [Chloroflexota bacterium]|nr:helix-turn-helix domain containing protein [Chloroflexota bacterium]